MRQARTFLFLLSVCLLSIPLAAQTPLPSSWYYFTGMNGQRMSAVPERGELRWSPNTAGWESFMFNPNNGVLSSVHGTPVLVDPLRQAVTHAPMLNVEEARLELINANGKTYLFKPTDGTYGLCVADRGTLIAAVYVYRGQWPADGSCAWTTAPAPAGNVGGLKYAIAEAAAPLLIVSFHNTNMGRDSANRVTHSESVFKWFIRDVNAFQPSRVIEYMQAVTLRIATASGGGPFLAFLTEGNVPVLAPTVEQWRIVDASGVRKRRVGYGDVVFLMSARTGLYLSADPAKPGLSLTTNRDAWEKWTIKR